MDKKYELVDFDTDTDLYRVKALRDFGTVKAGDIGGWVAGDHNLSHKGDCWVYGDARVFGNARVSGDAQVFGNALVTGDAQVFGNARVSGDAVVFGNARVSGDAVVFGNAQVFDNAHVTGNALICNAWVGGTNQIYGNNVKSNLK